MATAFSAAYILGNFVVKHTLTNNSVYCSVRPGPLVVTYTGKADVAQVEGSIPVSVSLLRHDTEPQLAPIEEGKM